MFWFADGFPWSFYDFEVKCFGCSYIFVSETSFANDLPEGFITFNQIGGVKYLNCSCMLQLAWLIYTLLSLTGPTNLSYVWLVHDPTRPLSVLYSLKLMSFSLNCFSYLLRKHDLPEVLISTWIRNWGKCTVEFLSLIQISLFLLDADFGEEEGGDGASGSNQPTSVALNPPRSHPQPPKPAGSNFSHERSHQERCTPRPI